MTTTVLELLANLKHYPDNTVITIQDVNDVEFAIVDLFKGDDGVTIVISEKAYAKEEVEAA